MAQKLASYSKRQDGDATVFDVTPAPPPKFWYLIIFGGFIALLGLGMLAGGPGIIFLAMAAFAIWYGWTRDLRPKPHRKPSTFRTTPTTITSGEGQSFNKDDIHRLLLRNAITDQELGLDTYTTNSNVAAGMAFRAQSARGAYALTLESGGRSTLLAGGMDETTAYGLLQDVSKVVGFTGS